MSRDYDFREVETRWARTWVERRAWAAPELPSRPKRYALTMFPYPSGDMHMGHVETFSIHDAIARYLRMRGWEVLNPLGFDAFGLPAENAAIKRGIHPKKWTYANVETLRSSAERLGCSYDWDRTFRTCDPEYYRWNQWLFLRFYERGLAYRKEAPVNWCPNDKTVLANEQVVAGRCERCDAVVEKRYMTQWFFRTTSYADRLLDDMDLNAGWSERLKMLQSNWIGRSHGAEVEFRVEGLDEPVTVFTTRPDTLWGATFFVVAPEHPLAERLVAGTPYAERLAAFRKDVERLTEVDRTSTERRKDGVFLGRHAVNPVNGERIPVWAADYVLMDYGTGAIMAVPAHDQRDFEFARAHDLPVRVVIRADGDDVDEATMTHALEHRGVMVSSGPFDGTPADDAVRAVTAWLEARGIGRAATSFRLRDWLISRQRYWGTPIPIVHCERCGEVAVPDDRLPVELPDVVDFTPTGEASPLATARDWVETSCPRCDGPARRETDTMDTFVDSSWYFLRYLDPHNDDVPFERAKADAWMPIDQYTGGIEHAVLHLIYARFFQKVLMDMGMVRDPEPFPIVLNQGQVTMGGKRMSKSRGNLVDPQEAFELYGADALRLYMLFSGPPEQDFDWPPEGVRSIGRVTFPWINRVWRLCEDNRDVVDVGPLHLGPAERALRKHLHRTIDAVTRDYEERAFNTAIAQLMELVNQAYRYRRVGGGHPGVMRELVEALLKMLAPMAPFVTEELWRRLGHDRSIHFESWPEHDPALVVDDEVTMVVQVNGKVRDAIPVPADVDADEMRRRALTSEKVRAHLGGREPAKVFAKPPKVISLVAARD
ncbi:MAG TPA: leucine--tRNA ligase [Actinomycetota bacterium]|nr:leucine--tRNA ligase [Actinomycetota bacterium]